MLSKWIIVFILTVFFCSYVVSYDFAISSSFEPIPGKKLASLQLLQNDYEYSQSFIEEYNYYGGIHIESVETDYCCILVLEGVLYKGNALLPYQDGIQCSSFLTGIVEFGFYAGIHYPTMSSSLIDSFTASFGEICGMGNSYALYGPEYVPSVTPSPTRTPSNYPSPGSSGNFIVASTSQPALGKVLVSLFDLKTNANYAQMFINDYNNGLLIENNLTVPYCCISVKEGALSYQPGGSFDLFDLYINGSNANCEPISSPTVQFGTDTLYFETVNSSLISLWDYNNFFCGPNDSYCLYGPQASSI